MSGQLGLDLGDVLFLGKNLAVLGVFKLFDFACNKHVLGCTQVVYLLLKLRQTHVDASHAERPQQGQSFAHVDVAQASATLRLAIDVCEQEPPKEEGRLQHLLVNAERGLRGLAHLEQPLKCVLHKHQQLRRRAELAASARLVQQLLHVVVQVDFLLQLTKICQRPALKLDLAREDLPVQQL